MSLTVNPATISTVRDCRWVGFTIAPNAELPDYNVTIIKSSAENAHQSDKIVKNCVRIELERFQTTN